VPFGFLRRKKAAPSAVAGTPESTGQGPRTGIAFEALTEEWRIAGRMHVTGRLSDALNRREPVDISDVTWGPVDSTAPLEPAPGLRSVDPYDLILVVTGGDSTPPLTDAEREAHRVHKVSYDVALELPPFRVVGTIFMHPGSEPERLLDRSTEMFVPVVDAVGYQGDLVITDPEIEAILVNRFYLRGVEQVDKRTGQKPQRLPGQPLGGTSWHERSR